MNLDERLEALTQSVELLASMQRDGERRFQEQFDKIAAQFSQHEQLFGQVALRIREVNESVDTLARIAGVHQDRLDGHERRLKDLEQ